jgi:hypothetical protein
MKHAVCSRVSVELAKDGKAGIVLGYCRITIAIPAKAQTLAVNTQSMFKGVFSWLVK